MAHNTCNAFLTDIGRIAYDKAKDFQNRLVAARKEGRLCRDLFLFLEHPPVFTLGRRGGRENLIVPDRFLEEKGIPMVQAERGGNITYHGPGQLVVYPIMDLDRSPYDITTFVSLLEDAMIRTLAAHAIHGNKQSVNRGVFTAGKKIGSVGIALRRGITFHGLALNVNMDLTPFSYIHPCGLTNMAMTSMEEAGNGPVTMAQVKAEMKCHLADLFGLRFKDISLKELHLIFEGGHSDTPSDKEELHA